jgi:hypothetical protein
MAEWEFVVDSDDLPEPQPEEPSPSRRFQWWYLLAITVLAVLTIGAVTLYRQRADRQAAMRADLQAIIFEEETVRFFGQQDQAGPFILPGAPSNWQQQFHQTFETGPARLPPADFQLNNIEFDGQCALVSAKLDDYTQLRTYCLHNQQWHRAPTATDNWGDDLHTIDLPGAVQLVYQARDQDFATTLARDLPGLFEKLSEWQGQPNGTPSSSRSLQIIIEAQDLAPPLIAAEAQRIVLNSPWLVPFSGDGIPSGQAAVRLALAQALLHRTDLIAPEATSPLPGAVRLQAAAQQVLAANLLLPSESRTSLTASKRARLDGDWISPFYIDRLANATSTNLTQAELAAYVMADYISRTEGSDALLALLQQLPAAGSWDSLFHTTLNRPAVALEKEAAAYSRTGNVHAGESLAADGAYPVAPELPLRARLLGVKGPTAGMLQVSVQPVDTEEPVLVEMAPDLAFRAPGGDPLPVTCLPPDTVLNIDGGWLEIQRRLQASQVTVQQVMPLPIEPAPAGTVAYLIEGEPPTDPKLVANTVFPSQRPYSVAGELIFPRALVALRQDGSLHSLTSLSRSLRVMPLPISKDGPVHFLFIVDLPECDRSWFVHYEHQKGVRGQWLGPPQPAAWVWQSDQQRLLLLNSKPGGAGHNIYGTDEKFSLQPVGETSTLVSVAGWNKPAEQIVFVKRAWMGAIGIGLLDPGSGAIRRAKVYIQPLRARRLSPDGNWLTYLTGVRNRFDPPYRLDALNLETLQETTLVQVEDHQAIGSAIWSPYLAHSQLAVLAGSLDQDGMLQPARILLAGPDQPGTYEVVVEAGPGEQVAMPVFCRDGSLLYRTEQNDQYRLMHQLPATNPAVLLTRDRPFQPLACP